MGIKIKIVYISTPCLYTGDVMQEDLAKKLNHHGSKIKFNKVFYYLTFFFLSNMSNSYLIVENPIKLIFNPE